MLREFDRLVARGGALVIGTPNATRIDVRKPEEFIHALHVPFHRHIFSERALHDVGRKLGWEPLRFYPHSYHSTPIPFLNYRFALFYMASFDNTVDALLDGKKTNARLLFHPLSHFYALFGGFLPPTSDCQILFRAPTRRDEARARHEEQACTPS